MNYHDQQALFPENISDEAAFQLIPFFYRLAAHFESKHLAQARRYEKKLAKKMASTEKSWGE